MPIWVKIGWLSAKYLHFPSFTFFVFWFDNNKSVFTCPLYLFIDLLDYSLLCAPPAIGKG